MDACGFADVKFVIFAPAFDPETGNLTGANKGMKVDVAISRRADKVLVTNKDGGGELRQIAMTATCAAVGADLGSFEGGGGTANEYESALKRRKIGKACNNLFTVNSGFMLAHFTRTR